MEPNCKLKGMIVTDPDSDFKRYCSVGLSVLVILACFGCLKKTKPEKEVEEMILARLERTPTVFVADGAHDYHVSTDLGELDSEALCNLVRSISDNTPTQTVYRTGNAEVVVPLGYLVLDVLLLLSPEESPVFSDSSSGDDVPWASVRHDYVFTPDILNSPGGREIMSRVQKMWMKELEAGALQFRR